MDRVLNLTFKPLEETDLNLLCIWLDKPHIKEWWNDKLSHEEIQKKYRKRIGDTIVVPFIVYLNNKSIGFIQYYLADKVGDGWWPDEVEGTVGIDQFIGDENFIDRGYGTQMIEQFIAKLFSTPDIKKIITDVDKNNHRAIRCYEKAGFCFSHTAITPDGPAHLMNRYRNTSIEPHAYILKKPNERTLLYKIISADNFFNMLENNYLYFRRVDTYEDDTRDSDQPAQDKEASEKSTFEKAPSLTARHYYDSCRSKTYACCFSTENTSHLWQHYGSNSSNTVCLVFESQKLINFLNLNFESAKLLYENKQYKNFFNINAGLVTYGSFDEMFLKENLPNPIEYVYFKDKTKFSEEKEFRISLSCLGIFKYILPDGTPFNFPLSIQHQFDFHKAAESRILKKIILSTTHESSLKEDLIKTFPAAEQLIE